MNIAIVFKLLLTLCLTVSSLFGIQKRQSLPTNVNVRWCAPHKDYLQCLRLVNDTMKDSSLQNGRIRIGNDQQIGTGHAFSILLTCAYANHIFECADMILNDKADIARFTSEQLFGLSTSNSPAHKNINPLAVGATSKTSYIREYSTIVVKKVSNIKSVDDTKDRKACFGNVTNVHNIGYTSGWIIPIYNLQSKWLLKPRYDNCTSDFQVANDVLASGSCAPGLWAQDEVYSGQFTNRLCASCVGQGASCSSNVSANDPLVCLSSGRGDFAFVSSLQINRDFLAKNAKYNKNDYAIVCNKGSYQDVSDFDKCNFGEIPEDAYVGASIATKSGLAPSTLGKYVAQLFSYSQSSKYPSQSFIADDRVVAVQTMEVAMPGYLGLPPTEMYLSTFGNVSFLPAMKSSFPSCSKDQIKFCVDSVEEVEKCQEMQLAFKAAGLPTTLICLVAYSEDKCIQMLNSSQADLTMIASHRADSYIQQQVVRPILKENYRDNLDYAIAVATTSGKTLMDFQSLGQVCSSGTDSFAGWEAPNMILQQLGLIPKTCQLTEAWNQVLASGGGSCLPGAYNVSITLGRGTQFPLATNGAANLCKGCGSRGQGTCMTPPEASPPYHNLYDTYYGDVGALRCLCRRNGNLAFLRSSALSTMNILKLLGDPDFVKTDTSGWTLLCKDGKTSQPFNLDNVKNCNLGVVPEKWMVAQNTNNDQLLRWQNSWMLAFGRARSDYNWFKTYIPYNLNYSTHLLDLIFSNNTDGLKRLNFKDTSLQQFHAMAFNDPNYVNPFFCNSLACSNFSSICFLLSFMLVFLFVMP